MRPEPELSALETQVRADIATLGDLTKIQKSLAELAYALCQKLDGASGMPAASLARELRETLESIAEGVAPHDDISDLIADLSTPDYGGCGADVPA